MAIGVGLRQVQDAINRRADIVQHEFIEMSERLVELRGKLLELEGEEKKVLQEEHTNLRDEQQKLASEINSWRERARAVIQQPGEASLRSFLKELIELEDSTIQPSAERALHLLDLPAEERMVQDEEGATEDQSPAGRLLERARKEYDLRTSDTSVLQKEAIEFANRPGVPQDEEAITEIAEAIEDADPIVRELAMLTTIQLYRFRALRIADLEPAHQAVQYLAQLNHQSVVPVLIEIVQSPRTGYTRSESETVEGDNNRSRMVALLRLVEWHTNEAQNAIRGLKFDKDPHIVKAATRALALFSDPWKGPLKGGTPNSLPD